MAGEKAPGNDPGANEGEYLDYMGGFDFQPARPIPNYDWTAELAESQPKIEGLVWRDVFYPFPWTLPDEPSDG